MNEKLTISRNQLVQQILGIGHGDLKSYLPLGISAVGDEQDLFAHLIAWNFKKGEVRDSKVALPVIALRGKYDAELSENAVAHLVSLDPRNLVRAIEFNRLIKEQYPIAKGNGNFLESAVRKYIQAREENRNWWIRSVLQHRKSMKALYALYHIKPNKLAQDVLFDRKKPKGSVFEALANLKNMNSLEAAGTILHYKIPFLIAIGAIGGIKNNTDIIMALIDQTSGSELINNTEMFRKLGVFDNPILRTSFDIALERAKKDKKVSSFKASKLVEKTGDAKVAKKMKEVSEEKLEQLGGIEGVWLILSDCSGSMHESIAISKIVAATIAQQVKDTVHLIFFNTAPYKYDVTGKSLEEIKKMTSRIHPSGATNIGCGLEMLLETNTIVNGIVICSDGGENRRPSFAEVYKKYVKKMGIEPTVYHLWVPGDPNYLEGDCKASGVRIEKFDVSQMDYYALPNLIKTLRSSRYSLIDEIMNTKLLTLNDVFLRKGE